MRFILFLSNNEHMTQIDFYHLTRTHVFKALPPLLSRTLASGQKAVIWCTEKKFLDELDKELWKIASPSWLPHGRKGILCPDIQPIWLTTEEDCPNAARFLFLLENRECPYFSRFDRVFDLFDGHNDNAIAAARTRWTAAKTAGFTPSYWQQEEKGWKRAR